MLCRKAAAKDRACDRFELGPTAGGDVLLHRAAHLGRRIPREGNKGRSAHRLTRVS
jgi:hypothetical protein